MARIKVRYLAKKPGRGGTTRYFWTPGPALRKAGWQTLRLAEDTGLEVDAIAEAEELNARVDAWRAGEDTPADKNAPPAHGSMNELIRIYQAADEFRDLQPKTKRRYLQNIKVIEDWAGDTPYAAIHAKAIKGLYKAFVKAGTPGKAVQVVGMIRILFSFAMSESLSIATRPKTYGSSTTAAPRPKAIFGHRPQSRCLSKPRTRKAFPRSARP